MWKSLFITQGVSYLPRLLFYMILPVSPMRVRSGGLRLTDVTLSLEFVSQCAGDVDLNDGKLDGAYQLYISSLQFVAGLGLKSRRGRDAVVEDLKKIRTDLLEDKDLL